MYGLQLMLTDWLETRCFSAAPAVVVGTYSGPDQLGEGFGSSLSMAECRLRTLSPVPHARS